MSFVNAHLTLEHVEQITSLLAGLLVFMNRYTGSASFMEYMLTLLLPILLWKSCSLIKELA